MRAQGIALGFGINELQRALKGRKDPQPGPGGLRDLDQYLGRPGFRWQENR
jgi:hypothetical protein